MAIPPSQRKTPGRKPRVKNRHLTAGEIAEACALWASGEGTMAAIAKKFGKHPSTMQKVFEREGVRKNERAAENKEAVKAAVKEAIVNDAQIIAGRVADTKEEHYKMATGLAKLIWHEIATAKKENRPVATAYHNIKTLKIAAEGLKVVRDERYTILGIREEADDQDKPIPELIVKELTAQDIKDMQRQAAIQAADELGIPAISLGDEDMLDDDGSLDDVNGRIEVGE